ncbi:hypothetical protein [Patulibacter defluvii]|uniref:hypothetical protein n=1 Tax=Patulibacter defluvii TaxID=3095358 RepID=UPI002A75BACE|nr:hypothetical protein [Patulibacter sp. DM4]
MSGGGATAPRRGPRALAYLAGGAATTIAQAGDRLPLERVPLAVGGCLLACALLCGRRDGPWGAALVVVGVGLGALAADRGWTAGIELSTTAGAAFGGGIGLLAVLLLDRRLAIGVPGTVLAIAATIAVLRWRDELPALGRPATWGVWLLLLGAVNLLLWARDRELGSAGPRR